MNKIYLLSLVALLFISSNAIAQNKKSVNFKTSDGINIVADYELPKNIASKVPVIILIHSGGSSKESWKRLEIWNSLLKEGFALLAYDIRIHGKSGKDKGDLQDLFNNPKRSPLDLQAAIDFLLQDERIDPNKIGIIGSSVGANLACVAASSEVYPVKSVVSMSSKVSAVQNLSGTKSPISLENVFHIASEKEQWGYRKNWANELYQRTKGNKKLVIADGESHGSSILRDNTALQKEIIDWFKETLSS